MEATLRLRLSKSYLRQYFQAGIPVGLSKQTLLKASAEGIIDQQVVALGGVSYQRLAEVEQLGFGGYAMLGEAWKKMG